MLKTQDFKERFLEKYSLIGLCLVAFIHTLLRFQGIHHGNYRESFQYPLDKSLYSLDIFVKNSLLYDASILYKAIEYFKIDFNNDFIGIFPYLFLSFLSIWTIYLLVKEFFGVQSLLNNIMLIILLIYGEGKILLDVKSALILPTFPTPTWFSHALAFLCIYLLLKHRFLLFSTLLTLTIAILVKTNWLLIPIALCYITFHPKVTKKNLLFILLPILYMVWKAKSSITFGVPKEELLARCENIIFRNDSEDCMHLQPLHMLIIFGSSFILYHRLLKNILNENLRIFLKWSSILTIVMSIFGYLYTWKIYKIYPNPYFFLISPPRSTELYSMLFILVLGYSILVSEKLNILQKFLLILFSAIFKISYLNRIVLCLVAAPIVYYYPRFFPTFSKELDQKLQSFQSKQGILYFILFSLLTVKPLAENNGFFFDWQGYKYLNQWTIEKIEPQLFSILLELRNDPKDMLLLVVKDDPSKNAYVANTYENYIARKSKYIGDVANFYHSSQLFQLGLQRKKVVADFLEELNKTESSNFPPTTRYWEQLKTENVVLLLPNTAKWLIEKNKILKRYEAYTLLEFI